ncbi:hypothetical protein ACFV2N_07745 [Streptomyces sp. NPDC059680]|uniref:hypothetical protein n=1 Tax=Streptomyces sp. NPDC059680 TaxID=3346904 RepID=UPI0036C3FAE2
MVTAVSVFKEDPKNAGLQSMQGVGGYSKVFGADMPTDVWTGYMTAALQGRPVRQFRPAPTLGQSTDEYGAPSPTPSATATPTDTAGATTGGAGDGGLLGGTTGGGTSPTPAPTTSPPATAGIRGGAAR